MISECAKAENLFVGLKIANFCTLTRDRELALEPLQGVWKCVLSSEITRKQNLAGYINDEALKRECEFTANR